MTIKGLLHGQPTLTQLLILQRADRLLDFHAGSAQTYDAITGIRQRNGRYSGKILTLDEVNHLMEGIVHETTE